MYNEREISIIDKAVQTVVGLMKFIFGVWACILMSALFDYEGEATGMGSMPMVVLISLILFTAVFFIWIVRDALYMQGSPMLILAFTLPVALILILDWINGAGMMITGIYDPARVLRIVYSLIAFPAWYLSQICLVISGDMMIPVRDDIWELDTKDESAD